jgi:hypothetical protein
MEPEGPLPHSQLPATCLYPEPTQPSPYPHIPLPEAAAISEPALYRLLTFQVPNLMSLFRCLGRTKVSVQVRGFVCEYFVTKIRFHSEELLAPRPNPKPEDHPLSAVRDCLFNIFAATLHIGGRSSNRNPRTLHAVVTGPTYNMAVLKLRSKNAVSGYCQCVQNGPT